MVWEIISLAISTISIVVAVVTFLISHFRTKRVETLQRLDALFDGYYAVSKKSVKECYKEWAGLLSRVERFAAAYNGGVYNKRIIKNRASTFLCKLYNDHLQELIIQRRKQFKKGDYYHNTEVMVKDLKK